MQDILLKLKLKRDPSTYIELSSIVLAFVRYHLSPRLSQAYFYSVRYHKVGPVLLIDRLGSTPRPLFYLRSAANHFAMHEVAG